MNSGKYWKEDKEVAKLRWEYLLFSEKYNKFCIQQRDYKGEKDLQYIFSLGHTVLGNLFLRFGDIHSKAFDDYWKELIHNKTFEKRWNDTLIKDFNNWNVREYNIGEDIDYCITQYEKYTGTGKKPTVEELKEGLIRLHNGWIEHDRRTYLVIRSENTIKGVNEVIKEIGKLLKRRVTKKRFIKEELERYLRVYTMRKKEPPVPYRDIHKKEFPTHRDYTDNHRRARISDFNRAKRIINNVENNLPFFW